MKETTVGGGALHFCVDVFCHILYLAVCGCEHVLLQTCTMYALVGRKLLEVLTFNVYVDFITCLACRVYVNEMIIVAHRD